MAYVVPAMMVIGAAVSAYGAVAQANAAQTAGKFNAEIQERDAKVALDQSKVDAARVRRQVSQAQGSLLAGYGAAGVDTGSGSPLDVLQASAVAGKLDEETVLYRGRLKAMGHQDNAALSREGADTANSQGYMNAASYLLTGVGRAGSTYYAGQRPLRQTNSGYGGYPVGYDD